MIESTTHYALRICRFVTVSCALMVAACSFVVNAGRPQCETDDDCSEAATGKTNLSCEDEVCQEVIQAGPWDCVNTPAPTFNPEEEETFPIQFIAAVTRMPIAGVQLKVCRGIDVACQAPIADGIVSDASGRALVTAPKGFRGYAEITATGYLPVLFGINMPSRQYYPQADPPVPLQLLSREQFLFLVNQAGVTWDETLGQLSLLVVDCSGESASGVTFEAEPTTAETATFYFQNGLPSQTATATDDAGNGGFISVPIGSVTVHAFVPGTGDAGAKREVGSNTMVSRAGWLTFAGIDPKRE